MILTRPLRTSNSACPAPVLPGISSSSRDERISAVKLESGNVLDIKDEPFCYDLRCYHRLVVVESYLKWVCTARLLELRVRYNCQRICSYFYCPNLDTWIISLFDDALNGLSGVPDIN